MTKTADAFAVNERVNHGTFGCGTIKFVDSQYTTIAFDDRGTKKFLTQVVQLEHSDVPRPRKPGRVTQATISKPQE